MHTRYPSLVRHAGIALAALIVVLVVPFDASAQPTLRETGRGLAAMTTGFLEIPRNMYRDGQAQEPEGVALGFARGLALLVPRTLVGVHEFVAALIPAPAGFRSILKPA
jgi:putative exosortase-associated protein (TIGR04073 family)